MNIVRSYLVNNPYYTANKKIAVKGLMLHSVGAAQPKASVFINTYNNKTHTQACVHAFIDGNNGKVYQTLPWDHRGAHAGGSANNTHIGIEMCEPASIKYTSGANFKVLSLADAKLVVTRTYNSAVELFAYLCKEFNLDPLKDGVIISHSEGNKRGLASGHADPEHLWKQLGVSYTMDGFRKDVAAKLKPASGTMYKVQAGAFSVKSNATVFAEKLRAAGFDAYIIKVGSLYKVQVGAFSNRDNARNTVDKLREAGFTTYIQVV